MNKDIQRTDEWIKIDDHAYDYHLKQWNNPKRSTVSFQDFISKKIQSSANILDLGCGAGASTAFIARHAINCHFHGLDLSSDLINIGNRNSILFNIKNISFSKGNIYELNYYSGVDGVISLQTLSWLPDYQEPIIEFIDKISPKWMAFSSLFYEGDISCRIEVTEHARDRKTFYNVYSLKEFNRFLGNYGYSITEYKKFLIDIDINKDTNLDVMSTYTQRTIDDSEEIRLQISGPLLMNWYFVMIEKD